MERVATEVDGLQLRVGDLDGLWVLGLVKATWTLRALLVLLAAIRLTITWCEISGLPRQFIEM